jgi:hypothetical protein
MRIIIPQSNFKRYVFLNQLVLWKYGAAKLMNLNEEKLI